MLTFAKYCYCINNETFLVLSQKEHRNIKNVFVQWSTVSTNNFTKFFDTGRTLFDIIRISNQQPCSDVCVIYFCGQSNQRKTFLCLQSFTPLHWCAKQINFCKISLLTQKMTDKLRCEPQLLIENQLPSDLLVLIKGILCSAGDVINKDKSKPEKLF